MYRNILFHLLQTGTRSFIAKFMRMYFKFGYCNLNIYTYIFYLYYCIYIIVYIMNLFSFKWFLVVILYFALYNILYFTIYNISFL